MLPIEEINNHGHDAKQVNTSTFEIYLYPKADANNYTFMLPERYKIRLLINDINGDTKKVIQIKNVYPSDLFHVRYENNTLTVRVGGTEYNYIFDEDGNYVATGDVNFLAYKSDIVNPVQSDWNQNDQTQVDYVKNKPFYTYEEVLFDETVNGGNITGPILGAGYNYKLVSYPKEITLGEEYIINIDGTERPFTFWLTYGANSTIYICECEPGLVPHEHDWALNEIRIMIERDCVSNILQSDGDQWTKEFQKGIKIDLTNSDYICYSAIILPDNEPTTHNIKVYRENIRQLDEKYIPNTIARAEDLKLLPIDRLADFGATVWRSFNTDFERIVVDIPITLENPGNYIFYAGASDYKKALDGYVCQFNIVAADGSKTDIFLHDSYSLESFFINITHDKKGIISCTLIGTTIGIRHLRYSYNEDGSVNKYDTVVDTVVIDSFILSTLNEMTSSKSYTPTKSTDVATKGYVDDAVSRISTETILTSPNGTQYKLTVSDEGALLTEAL